MVTDGQVRKLMNELERTGRLGESALRSGMSEKTARKYVRAGKLPSERKKPRRHRTRENPFEEDWGWVEERLESLPGVQGKTLFEALLREHPERYQEGQLRTLQRHIKRWRGQHGPAREVFFPQQHRPGERLQSDFTVCDGLGVRLGGEAFPHQLFHSVLPYSNWECAVVCRSEAFLPLKRGLQRALEKLGRVPEIHQTDHSTAACHRLGKGEAYVLNDSYRDLMEHLGLKAHLIGIGKKEQNGDVESSHKGLKNRLEQYLLLRGSREFESVESYQEFVDSAVKDANRGRQVRLAEELEVMTPLRAAKLPVYQEFKEKVGPSSTLRVKVNTYSVPSRLIGHWVKVRLFEEWVEVWYGGTLQVRCRRLAGKGKARIDYRHVIWSLVNKPGAFERYRYREELFPSVVFRQAWDKLQERHPGRGGDLRYLRVLHLAASTMESEVEAAVALLLETGEEVSFDRVKGLIETSPGPVPEVSVPALELGSYDELVPGLAGEVMA